MVMMVVVMVFTERKIKTLMVMMVVVMVYTEIERQTVTSPSKRWKPRSVSGTALGAWG